MDTDYCRSRISDDIDIGDIEATNKDAIDRSRGIVMYIRFTKLVL